MKTNQSALSFCILAKWMNRVKNGGGDAIGGGAMYIRIMAILPPMMTVGGLNKLSAKTANAKTPILLQLQRQSNCSLDLQRPSDTCDDKNNPRSKGARLKLIFHFTILVIW